MSRYSATVETLLAGTNFDAAVTDEAAREAFRAACCSELGKHCDDKGDVSKVRMSGKGDKVTLSFGVDKIKSKGAHGNAVLAVLSVASLVADFRKSTGYVCGADVSALATAWERKWLAKREGKTVDVTADLVPA